MQIREFFSAHKLGLQIEGIGIKSFLLVAFLLCGIPVRAEVPAIDYLFPAGGKQGTTMKVSAGGKMTPWPLNVWTDCPGLEFNAGDTNGIFKVSIGTNAPAGPHWVRFYNQDGASAPRLFVVGTWSEIQESSQAEAGVQRLTNLPIVVNGRFDKAGDSDSFAVPLERGQWLAARVDAYRIDSPVDPVLQLLDSQGTQLAYNHDARALDPVLVYQAQESTTLTLQLFAFAFPPRADINFFGSDAAVYRMTLTSGPSIEFAFPAGVPRSQKSLVHLFGWNLPSTNGATVREVDATRALPSQKHLALSVLDSGGAIHLPLGNSPEDRELEPNDTPDLAQPVACPRIVNGRIDPPGDIDRFRFNANKGDRFHFQIRSVRLGFPLDPMMTVDSETGTNLAKADHNRIATDPELHWTAPADGSYLVSITDLIQRGGSNFVYRLDVNEPIADFKATVDNHAYRIEPGKSTPMKINVSRINSFKDKILVVAENLPTGVTATVAEVPEKGGEVQMQLAAANDAKAGNQPFRVLAVTTNPDAPKLRVATAELKGQHARQLLIDEIDPLWITVLPAMKPQ